LGWFALSILSVLPNNLLYFIQVLKMRIMIVNGSARANGYTNDILAFFCRGVQSAGGTIDVVNLRSSNIFFCQGCYTCWHPDHAGKCKQTDDMADIIQRYQEADVLVLATPVYFYSFSARLKVFLERLLPMTQPELETGRSLGLHHNKIRNKQKGPKKSVLIAVAGHRDTGLLGGIQRTYELIADSLDLEQCGKILRRESFFWDFSMAKPITIRRVRAAIEKAGREIVELGAISPKTESDAALHLTNSPESYAERFTHYWQIASENEEFVYNRESLKKKVLGDLRIMMPELALCLDPVAAGDLNAVFLFEVSGEQSLYWHLVVNEGNCKAFPEFHSAPDVTIHTTAQTLLDIFRQRIDARRSIAKGDLKVSGDRRLFMRFGRLFPPPAG
jgi:multimeric flavodoxin WrbA